MTEICAIRGRVGPATARRLKKLIRRAERYFKIPLRAEVSLVFVPPAQMQLLNQHYRGKSRPTTTLSFSQQTLTAQFHERIKTTALAGSSGPLILGEIFLCRPEIKKYARLSRTTVGRALDELALHSFLHLLGYHHSTRKGQEKMEALSRKIISLT